MIQLRGSPVEEAETKRRHALADFFVRLVREKPLGAGSGVIVLVFLFAGILADVVAPYGMNEMNLFDLLAAPSAKYLLGADHLGRDILSRLVYGARISLIVGVGATTITVVVGAIIGIPSGYLGGKFDMIVQRFVDAWMCFPGLMILITVMSMLGRGMLQTIVVLGILSGIGSSRLVRSAVIGIKENAYFQAAQAIGSSNTRTVMRHVIPNIMPPIIIIFSITVAGMILTEASLSFLGFGLPPDIPSWGGMLSGEGRQYMEEKPELALLPGLCLAVVVFSLNMFGDAVRDLLDPRLRGGVGRYGATRGRMKEAKGQRGK